MRCFLSVGRKPASRCRNQVSCVTAICTRASSRTMHCLRQARCGCPLDRKQRQIEHSAALLFELKQLESANFPQMRDDDQIKQLIQSGHQERHIESRWLQADVASAATHICKKSKFQKAVAKAERLDMFGGQINMSSGLESQPVAINCFIKLISLTGSPISRADHADGSKVSFVICNLQN
jgi:hypothetical protein